MGAVEVETPRLPTFSTTWSTKCLARIITRHDSWKRSGKAINIMECIAWRLITMMIITTYNSSLAKSVLHSREKKSRAHWHGHPCLETVTHYETQKREWRGRDQPMTMSCGRQIKTRFYKQIKLPNHSFQSRESVKTTLFSTLVGVRKTFHQIIKTLFSTLFLNSNTLYPGWTRPSCTLSGWT